MQAWTSQKPQKLTSQHHRNTRLWSLITCEHAAKSWGSTTSISLSYRLAKSRAISPLASPRSLNGARRLGQRGAPFVGRRRRRRRRPGLGIGPGGHVEADDEALLRLPLPLEQVARRPDLESVTMISNSSRRRPLGPNLPKFWLLVCLMSHR